MDHMQHRASPWLQVGQVHQTAYTALQPFRLDIQEIHTTITLCEISPFTEDSKIYFEFKLFRN